MMSSRPLPQWHTPTQPPHGRIFCRRDCFSQYINSIPGGVISLCAFLLVGLIFYMTFLSPHGPLFLSSSEWSIPPIHAFSSPTAPYLPSDALSLEQIREIVAHTRGFLSRDYSLYLGWNNVSTRGNPIRAKLDNPKKDAIYSRRSPSPNKFA